MKPERLASSSQRNPGTTTTKDPTALDRYVGARLRLLRLSRGLTQADLGQRLGVSFQQVQKYERGSNRISAGRLFEVSQLLGTAVDYFFDGLDKKSPVNSEPVLTDPESNLFSMVYSIEDRLVLKRMLQLISSLATLRPR